MFSNLLVGEEDASIGEYIDVVRFVCLEKRFDIVRLDGLTQPVDQHRDLFVFFVLPKASDDGFVKKNSHEARDMS